MAISPAARDDGAELNDTTSHRINFDTLGNIDQGDGLLVWIGLDGATGLNVPSNWDIAINRVGPDDAIRGVLAYSTATGNEGNSVTFTTNSPTTSVHRAWRFDRFDIAPWDTDPPEGSTSVADQGFISSPTHDVSWSAGEQNWWVGAYAADDVSSTVNAFPGAQGQAQQFTRAGGAEAIGVTEFFDRQRDSLNPGVWAHQDNSQDAQQIVAITAAVRPRAADPTTVTVGTATETDTAEPITPLIVLPAVTVQAATEVDTAGPVTSVLGPARVPVGAASETDTAQQIGIDQGPVPVGAASEIDSAGAVEPRGEGDNVIIVETADETDTAGTVTAVVAGAVTIEAGEARETNQAQNISDAATIIVVPVAAVRETDNARSITPVVPQGPIPIGTANELDNPGTITGAFDGPVRVPVLRIEDRSTANPIDVAGVGVGGARILRVEDRSTANPIRPTPGAIRITVGEAVAVNAAGSISPIPGAGAAQVRVGAATERNIAGAILAPGQTPDFVKLIRGIHAACHVPNDRIVLNQAARRSARNRRR